MPKILSLAEIRGVYFPMLKVKSLTLDTVISQYVIPGIERLLQNSPDLEKLTVRGRTSCKAIPEHHLDQYLKSQSLKPDQCWKSSKDGFNWNTSCWYVQPKHVTAFVELVLEKTEKLDKMVLLLDKRYLKSYIEDLTATLAHNNNVTIGPLPPTSQRCCVLSALLLSCADGASDNKATSGNTPSAGGCGGAGCGGGCGD
ncbi:hypothetical protein DY000_02050108 [Brassica cretica]|uniref:FBD domain-containing protein n=1 Tax=Brassica cretica TaxID=69181 RepID=A0ABQ7EWD4_BRACR|nr:hypothetical protein DY000_02050108 [Brassica cretica]